MTVYVDELVDYGYGAVPQFKSARYWCHMYADSLEELHEMADNIGMRRSWFQGLPKHRFPHYDLVPTRRAAAVRLGAKERTKPLTLDEYRHFCDLLTAN